MACFHEAARTCCLHIADERPVIAAGDREDQGIGKGRGAAIADPDAPETIADALAGGQGLGGRGTVVEAVANYTST